LTIEAYAWFSGAIVMSPKLRVLSGPALGTLASLTPTKVTFTGPHKVLPVLKVGDIITASATPKAPSGFLRRIVAAKPNSTGLVVTTVPATLGEAILQGALHIGSGAPVAPAAPAAPAASKGTSKAPARATRAAALTLAAPCSFAGAPVGLGLTISCAKSYGLPGAWSADVSGSLGVGLAVDIDVSRSLYIHTVLGVSGAASASATASGSASINVSETLADIALTPVPVPIGPIVVEITPNLIVSAGISGEVSGGLSANASVDGSATVTSDSVTGLSSSLTKHADGNVAITDTSFKNASLTITPAEVSVAFSLFESPASISVSGGFGVTFTADACNWNVGFGQTVGGSVSIDLFPGVSLSAGIGFAVPGLHWELPKVGWRNCAVWSGTLSYSTNAHHFDNKGRPVNDLNASEEVVLDTQTSGIPPATGLYTVKGSGSGAMILHQYSCDPTGMGAEGPITWNYNWGDSVGGSGSVAFLPATAGPEFTAMSLVYGGSFPGTYTISSACTATESGPRAQFSWFRMLPSPDTLTFSTPAGQSVFTETRTFDVNTPDLMEHDVFTYNLTKTCSLGGTEC
jgi:hypothetical protein